MLFKQCFIVTVNLGCEEQSLFFICLFLTSLDAQQCKGVKYGASAVFCLKQTQEGRQNSLGAW